MLDVFAERYAIRRYRYMRRTKRSSDKDDYDRNARRDNGMCDNARWCNHKVKNAYRALL
jgi:hypothetical protein